jgi:rod shape-determining protein MreC
VSSLTIRQTVILVLLFVVASAALIGLDSRNTIDPFKGTVQNGLGTLTGGLSRLGEGGDPSELEAEIERLRAENDILRVENAELRGVARENEQLRAQLDIEATYPEYELLSAGVISYDPSNLEKFIVIDKGSDDGVRKGMAVVDPNYYVGQVTEVSPSTAKVMLLIDGTQRIAARLVDSGATGVLDGMWQAGGRAQLNLVDSDTEPRTGEQVVTVGGEQGTVGIPSQLVVGVVGEGIKRDEQSDLLKIPVVPYSDFDNLRVVTVVMEVEKSSEDESDA